MAGMTKESVWLAIAGVALALGFGLGRVTAPGASWGGETKVRGSAQQIGQGEKESGDKEMIYLGREGQASASVEERFARALVMGDPKTRDRELENSLSQASLAEVKKALDMALGLPEGAAKRAAMAKVMERWGQLEGPKAVAYAEKLFAESGNPDLLKDAMRGWGQTDPQASIAYTQAMEVGDGIRRDITRDLFRDWADRNPQGAASYAASNSMDVGRGGVTSLLADRWSKQDPQSAANWAMSLPAGKEQQRALDQLVQNWSDLNLQAAADFVSRQAPGENKDAMVSTLAREVAKEDPSAGLKWVSTLSDPALQERTAMGVLWRTARSDPVAAQQILKNSSLSATVQTAVLTKMMKNSNRGNGP